MTTTSPTRSEFCDCVANFMRAHDTNINALTHAVQRVTGIRQVGPKQFTSRVGTSVCNLHLLHLGQLRHVQFNRAILCFRCRHTVQLLRPSLEHGQEYDDVVIAKQWFPAAVVFRSPDQINCDVPQAVTESVGLGKNPITYSLTTSPEAQSNSSPLSLRPPSTRWKNQK
jgi:hypothetical protein